MDTSLWLIRGELLLLGLAFGLLPGRLIIVVKQAAPRHQLGVAIDGIRFFQMLGGAILGSVLRRDFAGRLGHGPQAPKPAPSQPSAEPSSQPSATERHPGRALS